MTKKRTAVTIEETVEPRALIIGEEDVTNYIAHYLKEGGCFVTTLSNYKSNLGHFDYIFQFANFEMISDVLKKNLKESGKFLFIETDRKEVAAHIDYQDIRLRIIKVGVVALWNSQELASRIIRAMFSPTSAKIIDNAKALPTVKTSTVFTPTVEKSQIPTEPIQTPRVARLKPHQVVRPSSQQVISVKKFHVSAKLIFTVFLLFIFTIAGSLYLYFSSIIKSVTEFNTHLHAANWSAMRNDISDLKNKLKIANTLYAYSYKILTPVDKTSIIEEPSQLLTAANNLLDTTGDATSSFAQFESSYKNPFNQEMTFTPDDFDTILKKIDSLEVALREARVKIEKTNIPFFPKEDFLSVLDSAFSKLVTIREVLPIFKGLFMAENSKTYLVLLQNNMELRPTGGFIGSFGILTVKSGKIVDFKISDVYSADGQLKGHVEPPAPIRKYLAQPNWFLRDSNFDPDFASSAVTAGWFLQKELGINTDGVIGINLYLVQNLLRILGPITLADFNNEVVTADNFIAKAQQHQKDFFAGSSSKKDFLTAATVALQIRLTGGNLPIFELLPVISEALENKNLLIYSKDETIQKGIEKQGWAGRMVNVGCANQEATGTTSDIANSCFADYLSIVEANLGVNKANFFVSKGVAVEKKIETNGQIVSSVTISYENKSSPDAADASSYTNYLRIFVPAGSRLLSATLNNSAIVPSDIDLENYRGDKSVYGLLLRVAPGNKSVLKLSYVLGSSLSADNRLYQFLFQKQAGDKTSSLAISMSSKSPYLLKSINFTGTTSSDKEIYYTTDTSVDRIFALEIVQ